MDISDTIAPNSDQLDAVDLLAGPRTFAIESVSAGNAEQPVNIHLVGFPRPWRPGKSMRRVLVAGWGVDASVYVGRRLTLFCDPTVRFGGAEVGGTRISHMSHLDKTLSVSLLVTRGKSAVYKVSRLVDDPRARPEPATEPAKPTVQAVEECTDQDALRAMWQTADAGLRRQIEARVNALKEVTPPADVDPWAADDEQPGGAA